jgi:hypothetical protein
MAMNIHVFELSYQGRDVLDKQTNGLLVVAVNGKLVANAEEIDSCLKIGSRNLIQAIREALQEGRYFNRVCY